LTGARKKLPRRTVASQGAPRVSAMAAGYKTRGALAAEAEAARVAAAAAAVAAVMRKPVAMAGSRSGGGGSEEARRRKEK